MIMSMTEHLVCKDINARSGNKKEETL